MKKSIFIFILLLSTYCYSQTTIVSSENLSQVFDVHLYNGKFSGSSKVDFLRGNGYEFTDSGELVEKVGGKLKLTPSQIERLTLEMFEIQKQFGHY
jgi:hypothetical protein